MTKNLRAIITKCGKNYRFAEVESSDQNAPSQLGKRVLVAMPHFLDEAMCAKTLEKGRATSRCEPGKAGSEIQCSKTADTPLPPCKRKEEMMVVPEEQIEPPIRAAIGLDRLSYLVDGLPPGIRVVNRRDEGQIPVVGGLHQLTQIMQAVDALA